MLRLGRYTAAQMQLIQIEALIVTVYKLITGRLAV